MARVRWKFWGCIGLVVAAPFAIAALPGTIGLALYVAIFAFIIGAAASGLRRG